MGLIDLMATRLKDREAKAMLRRFSIFQPSTISSTSNLADFSSNDYLSIATSSSLKDAFMRRASAGRVGGSTGSRLLDGNNGQGEMEHLEARLCRFFDAEHALLCPSGWEANVSLFSTVPQPGDVVLYDSLVHASVHDGMRRSRAHCVAFKHNDVRDFERQMDGIVSSGRLSPKANVFLAVETLYSMDGDYAPLPQLIAAARRHFPAGSGRFWTLVDEAHSVGVHGATGAGICQMLGLCRDPEVMRVCTFGKGFGSSGAVILTGSSVARQYIINYARPLIFSTAMPHANVHLIHASLDVLESEEGAARRSRLHANCGMLREELRAIDGLQEDEEGLLSLQPRAGSSQASKLPAEGDPMWLRAVCNAAAIGSDDSDAGDLPSGSSSTTTAPSPPVPLPSPIMPLLTEHASTRPLAAFLQSRGFLVRPITYPTVPLGRDRVRICVHSDNTEEQVRGLARAVREWTTRESRMRGSNRGGDEQQQQQPQQISARAGRESRL